MCVHVLSTWVKCVQKHTKKAASLFLVRIRRSTPLLLAPWAWLCSYTKSGNQLASESWLVVRKHAVGWARIQCWASIHNTSRPSTHALLTSTWAQTINTQLLFLRRYVILFRLVEVTTFLWCTFISHFKKALFSHLFCSLLTKFTQNQQNYISLFFLAHFKNILGYSASCLHLVIYFKRTF